MTLLSRRAAPSGAGTRTRTPRRARSAGLLPVTAARVRVEFLSFTRERSAMAFTFVFPIVLLVVFASAMRGTPVGAGVDYEQYFVAGMCAAGLFGASFQSLAIVIAIERDIGALKRLAGTPMPRSAYFAGKIIIAALVATVQNALLLTIGVLGYGLRLPAGAGPWLTYLWVAGLGTVACTLLGIGAAGIVKNGRTAPAFISPISIVLQFVSGVFFVFTTLPGWMQALGAVFPLKWMAQGMRSAFLPPAYAAHEPAGGWEHGQVALVLAAWCAVGAVLAVRTFRWRNRADG